MKKLKVGQILYSLNVGNAARHTKQELIPVSVIKIGKKYFTCGDPSRPEHTHKQYYISDWRQKTEYSADSILYENEVAWEDEKESSIIIRQICDAFKYYDNVKNLPIETLRKIKELIGT